MRLEEMTWTEVETYLKTQKGVILPTGSVEQHGPIGLIGTDAICAREITWAAADIAGAVVAPELAYAPAPFNMSFPGTVSLSAGLYCDLAREVMQGLAHHGFSMIYVLNGHGANLEPLRKAAHDVSATIRIRSWWDFDRVNKLRRGYYGDWEGMHATPSEVAITQATHRVVQAGDTSPPRKLSAEYIAAHAGDRHGPPDEHRRDFPDGRVGSYSELARPEHGRELVNAAAQAVAADFASFVH
ncbi:creatininase family protein [Ruegeria atlantica]|uniref:creatininase family protein n=1 Tax=Ruegeria atlantica TaxID=81569 RepID=UPI002494922E|nr:creatininase family protein [Ruegeria atlantica]